MKVLQQPPSSSTLSNPVEVPDRRQCGSALIHPLPVPLMFAASQSNSSLKKQRSRGIFSTFLCCFRNYNAEPPATNASPPPPPVEENGSPQKVTCQHLLLLVSYFSLIFVTPCFSVCLTLFLFMCHSLLCCSVTRSRSALSLVYVLYFNLFTFACWLSGLLLVLYSLYCYLSVA